MEDVTSPGCSQHLANGLLSVRVQRHTQTVGYSGFFYLFFTTQLSPPPLLSLIFFIVGLRQPRLPVQTLNGRGLNCISLSSHAKEWGENADGRRVLFGMPYLSQSFVRYSNPFTPRIHPGLTMHALAPAPMHLTEEIDKKRHMHTCTERRRFEFPMQALLTFKRLAAVFCLPTKKCLLVRQQPAMHIAGG